MTNNVILQDAATGEWLVFTQPKEIVAVYDIADVQDKLAYIDQQVNQHGLHAAGFLAYEAAAAFDSALQTHPATKLPLLWFGLFEAPARLTTLPETTDSYAIGDWQTSISKAAYEAGIDAVKAHIAAGETYQVNFTMRLRAPFEGSAKQLFIDLNKAQRGSYGAFVDGVEWAICSASPELFFTLDGNRLTSRPMKGTAARGKTLAEDEAQMDWLQQSTKNRAENVMIVDMIRNDFGRIAQTGSVNVPKLFEIERYPTVLQMTSTVEAKTDASFFEIMQALFPCASITGAPKVSTMQIISQLEDNPRGIYTGTMGYLAPNRKAQFNVAIRTVTVDRESGSAEYGTGGGIVWDSTSSAEYEECFVKARVLTDQPPQFSLTEALLFEPDKGEYYLFELHMQRLARNVTYFGVQVDEAAVRQALHNHAQGLTEPAKVRLLLSLDGVLTVQSEPAGTLPQNPKIGFAAEPVNSENVFLYFKTTHRDMYLKAKASRPDCDDVLLWNERGEVTEASASNVIFEIDGELVTAPISSGLLGGTQRQNLLNAGTIRERVITKADAQRATKVWLINSVRKWREAVLVGERVAG